MALRSTFLGVLLSLAACPADPASQPADTAPGAGASETLPGPVDDAWKGSVPAEIQSLPLMEDLVGMVFDATLADGLTVYADCSANLSQCVADQGGDFAACVAAAPVCQTETPWEEGVCCPRACGAEFSERVAAGASAHDAFLAVYAGTLACFPGVEERGGK